MKTLALGIAAVVVSAAGTAHAGVLTQADLAEGVSYQELAIDGVTVTVTTDDGVTKRKTVNGVTGVGVSGGTVNGEIDTREALNFDFASPLAVDEITIAFLYDNGQFGDHPAEVADFVTDLGTYTLQVTGPTTATWSGGGMVENMSIATEAGGGAWTLSGDLFGGAISKLSLVSGNPGSQATYADFSFVSLNAVPTPGAAALLGLGGLALARRRRA
ncbi:MAG: hypothetical protein RIB60_06465 [Phycisphaerales bacterium]